MALRHDGRSFAIGLELGTWEKHLKYLIGKKVCKLRGKDQHGKNVVAPSWTTMLTCEYEVRKYAMKKLNYSTISAGARRGKGQCRAPSSSLPHSPCSRR